MEWKYPIISYVFYFDGFQNVELNTSNFVSVGGETHRPPLGLQDVHPPPPPPRHHRLQHPQPQIPLTLLRPRQRPRVCWTGNNFLLHILRAAPRHGLRSLLCLS